ncbi:MAG: hypothetical protein ISS49_09985 [Anaerolineae bacterium]|nr:hypothetical protein [Anaerolineae bacterium]
MIEITLQVPENLAERLQPVREQLPEILEIGLQYSRPLSIRAYIQALEFLATAPTPAEILAFRPSPAIQIEVNRLLSRHKVGTLTPDEESELDRIGDLEHILMALKARARQQLDQSEEK